MPILPLPQFEADLAEQREADRKVYEALKAPKTLVVRYGFMKLVGEFPYEGDVKPGCGSKMIVRTPRGTEMGEMLTSTCANSGCGKSVSRQEMLRYIENSGGRDYPFFSEGRVLRVATKEDMDRQAAIEQSKHGLKMEARRVAESVGVKAKIVETEPLLGGERMIIYYASEERIELRDLHRRLEHELRSRVDLRHVGARDEARLTADYEKCGQYCCCKNFLKVLKPVSMKSAKVQKATLDPLKISGRCGRLMCCLRYEDETYDELRKRLPHKKTRVGTPYGDGFVVDSQILTQLVLVHLDVAADNGKTPQAAVPVEDLTPPTSQFAPPPPPEAPMPPMRSGGPPMGSGPGAPPREQRRDRPRPNEGRPEQRRDEPRRDEPRRDGPPRERGPDGPRPQQPPRPPASPPSRGDDIDDIMQGLDSDGPSPNDRPPGDNRGKRRRRRGRGGPGGGPGGPGGSGGPPDRRPPPQGA